MSSRTLVEFVQYCVHCLFMQRVRHIKQLPLDLESLTKGLSSLVLPSQQVHFSQHMYVPLFFFVSSLCIILSSLWFLSIAYQSPQ